MSSAVRRIVAEFFLPVASICCMVVRGEEHTRNEMEVGWRREVSATRLKCFPSTKFLEVQIVSARSR